MNWELVGYTAALLTMFSFVPQLVKMIRTKSVNDVSFPMLAQLGLGLLLWILYGIHLHNLPIIIANVVSFSILFIGLLVYFKYRSNLPPFLR
ncbi:MAG: SemiSWEET family sugar transporter [Methanotrichaceae archaeon]